jgi:hypothetical protein
MRLLACELPERISFCVSGSGSYGWYCVGEVIGEDGGEENDGTIRGQF